MGILLLENGECAHLCCVDDTTINEEINDAELAFEKIPYRSLRVDEIKDFVIESGRKTIEFGDSTAISNLQEYKRIIIDNNIGYVMHLKIASFGLYKQLTEVTSNSMNNRMGIIEYVEPRCLRNVIYVKDKSNLKENDKRGIVVVKKAMTDEGNQVALKYQRK
ncbi:hypothetical protein C1646_661775 [Rhizophagus diaphanus]|nr:hypothetical protein C1646_661775 [Rhizophagus diaphanus] [Rhizophagus sp. MUCL 43196]